MKFKRIVVLDAGFGTADHFVSLTERVVRYKGDLQPGDCLFFEGGTDINPAIYGEQFGRYTQHSDKRRDSIEMRAFEQAKRAQIPMVGICRGAQLICALMDGKLIQHVTGHHSTHEITTVANDKLPASSVHHQMMLPKGGKIIAWSIPRSERYLDGDDLDIRHKLPEIGGRKVEPEVVLYPEIRALAIQGHPEFCNKDHPFVPYCQQLVNAL